MKKILSLFLLCFCLVIFSGCAQCTYCVEYKQNGEIVQTFSTAVNRQELEQAGFSYVNLMASINNIYATYWANKQSSMLFNLNNNNALTATERTALFQSVTGEINNSENGLKLTITYPSSSVANLVNTDPTQEPTKNQTSTKITQTLFTVTQTQIISNAFVGIEETQLYNELQQIYVQSGAFSQQDLHLQHVIAFSTSRYKSNANYTTKQNNLTYHVWNLNTTPNQNGIIENPELEVYLTQAKPLAWYALAIIVSVLFIIVCISIVTIKQKSTKKV